MQADAILVQMTMFRWAVYSIGTSSGVMLAGVALLGFVVSILQLMRGKGPTVGVALMISGTLPIFVGALFALQNGVSAWFIVAQSTAEPEPMKLSMAVSSVLVPLWLGFWLAIPGYALAFFGTVFRSLSSQSNSNSTKELKR